MSGCDVRKDWLLAQEMSAPPSPKLRELVRFLGRSAAEHDFKRLVAMETQHQEDKDG